MPAWRTLKQGLTCMLVAKLPMMPVSSNEQAYPACIKTGVLNQQANVIGHTVVHSACHALVPFEWLLAEMEHPLALLTGCLTRWGSQVAAIIRLLQFKEAMLVVLLRKKQAILDTIARREQRDKAEVLLSAAQKDDFWSSLAHLAQNLLPIRIALRVLESDSA